MATRQRTAVNTALGLAMLLHLGVSVAAGGRGAQACPFPISNYNKTTDSRVDAWLNFARSLRCGDGAFSASDRREAKNAILSQVTEESAIGINIGWWNQWNALAATKCRSGYAYVLGNPRAVVEKYLNAYTCSTTRPRGGWNAHLSKK